MNKQGIQNTASKLKTGAGTAFARLRPGSGQRRTRAFSVAALLLACLSFGFLGGWIGGQGRQSTNSIGLSPASQQVVTSEGELISAIAKNVGQSVVSVNVVAQTTQTDFFGFSTPSQEEGAGTGVIISESGYILTNRHVVPRGTTQVSVTLSDGTELSDVQVVGRTNDSDPLDVAFLKITDAKGKKLTAAKIGDSSKLEVGSRVVAIGNALGRFQNSVTTGIISGYGRDITAGDESGSSQETLQNLLQTDAAINQGNSGGPLVNVNGEVIGLNTAVASGEAQNIGFAIPINDTKGLITSVLERGKLERPYLGVRYITLTDDYAYQYNLSVKRGAYLAPNRGQGVVVGDSPAAKAGLREKDIITKVDGVAIDEKNSLTSLVGRKSVGNETTLTIVRDGKEQDVKVKLEASPQQ